MKRAFSILWVSLLTAACQAQPLASGGVMLTIERARTSSPQAAVPQAPAPPPLSRPAPDTPGPVPSDAPSGSRGGGEPDVRRGVFSGKVVDTAELPLAGAQVLLADGRSALTDEQGAFSIGFELPLGAVGVSKAGYATSVVLAPEGLSTFHLRRTDGRTDPFDQRSVRIEGEVSWPSADHWGGIAYYKDSHDSYANPGPVGDDGRFAIEVTSRRAGEPMGAIVVIAFDSQERYLMGLSGAFEPFAGERPDAIPLHVASRETTFDFQQVPAGLTRITSRMELAQQGVPPFFLDLVAAASGTFPLPDDDALAAKLRLTVEASDTAGDRLSRITVTPGSASVAASFLPVPELALDGASRQAAWGAIADAEGYRLEVGSGQQAFPLWEGWTASADALAVPAEAWPSAGEGYVRLEAIDSPGLTTREVASIGPRRLRVAPWADRPHRISSRRIEL